MTFINCDYDLSYNQRRHEKSYIKCGIIEVVYDRQ